MKLLTLNTHSFIEENPLEKLEIMAKKIISENYDIVALQEVNQLICEDALSTDNFYKAIDSNPIIKKDNFAYLLQQKLLEMGIPYYWSYVPNHIGYDKYDEGVAILSRYPIKEAKSILISKEIDFSDYHTRRALCINIDDNGISKWFCSIHSSWWLDDKKNLSFPYQWQILTESILDKSKDSLVYFLGDFNNPAHIKKQGYSLINDNTYFKDSFILAKETFGEFTVSKKIDGWENNKGGLRIDYILVPKDTKVISYKIVFDGNNADVVSDHFGVEIIVI